jgi:hypothetical protein
VNLLLLLLPLLLLGFLAGGIRAWAALPGLTLRRRRLLQVGWVALLLFCAPAWLVLAAVLKLW